MKQETQQKTIKAPLAPIKTAYDSRLNDFRKIFNPAKVKIATGWVSTQAEA